MNAYKLLTISFLMIVPLMACAEKTDSETAVVEKQEVVVAQAAPQAAAPTRQYQDGVHYKTIERRVTPTIPTDQVLVQEMFWYGCPHCYQLEPTTRKWLQTKPADVVFQYVPAALNPAWTEHARAYYAAEELGLTEKTHESLFKAIHEQGRRLSSEDALVRFFSASGVNPEEFRAAMNSKATSTKINLSKSLAQRYGLTGVPSLVVDGQYRVLLDNISSYGELYEIVNYLIAKVKSDRSAAG